MEDTHTGPTPAGTDHNRSWVFRWAHGAHGGSQMTAYVEGRTHSPQQPCKVQTVITHVLQVRKEARRGNSVPGDRKKRALLYPARWRERTPPSSVRPPTSHSPVRFTGKLKPQKWEGDHQTLTCRLLTSSVMRLSSNYFYIILKEIPETI